MDEPTAEDLPQQLVADPLRQAHDKIRGYLYQIWQSVYAWTDLGDDEVLALEGGEDYDRLGPGKALATEVKDLAKNVTLRSEDVVESIANFWTLKEKNKGQLLLFRFLTTAQAGVEKGSPFGQDVAGIEYWKRAAKSGSGIDRLRSFLKTILKEDNNKHRPLLEFLKTAEDEEVRRELLQPFDWWLGCEPVDVIEAAVQRKLISYGEKRNVLASDSEKVAPHLLKAAFAAASRKTGRILHRSDFVKIFDYATSKRISSAKAQLISTLFPQSMPGLPGGDSSPIRLSSYSPVSAPPPLPPRLAPREKLVVYLSTKLSETGNLVLTGSTGMGKSTLAKLLTSNSRWLWAGLRTGSNANPSRVLAQLAYYLDSGADRELDGVVFDDYSPEDTDETLFGGILYTLRAKGIFFIITTSKTIPSRISVSLSLGSSFFQVPHLSRTEVEDWLAECGCPPDLLPNLASFLVVLTSGHPSCYMPGLSIFCGRGGRSPSRKIWWRRQAT
jgi:hypothetical protein